MKVSVDGKKDAAREKSNLNLRSSSATCGGSGLAVAPMPLVPLTQRGARAWIPRALRTLSQKIEEMLGKNIAVHSSFAR